MAKMSFGRSHSCGPAQLSHGLATSGSGARGKKEPVRKKEESERARGASEVKGKISEIKRKRRSAGGKAMDYSDKARERG